MTEPAEHQALGEMLGREVDGATVESLLLDARTPVAALKKLKDESKSLVRSNRAAATTVYYAAIASALVFHDHKITSQTYAQLHEGLSTLGAKPWIGAGIKDLFAKACEICRVRLPAGETETDD